MDPVWYHFRGDDGEYFIVYADANNSSSKRRFAAADGRFIDEAKGGAGTVFSQAFRADFRATGMTRLGSLNGRPALEDAVRRRRLPDDVVGELRGLQRSLVG